MLLNYRKQSHGIFKIWMLITIVTLEEFLKLDFQVVMAHSPLRMFKEFHSKHVLVVGQGPVGDIATSIGFQNVTTIEDLRHAFPALDAVDHKRRRGQFLFLKRNAFLKLKTIALKFCACPSHCTYFHTLFTSRFPQKCLQLWQEELSIFQLQLVLSKNFSPDSMLSCYSESLLGGRLHFSSSSTCFCPTGIHRARKNSCRTLICLS